jgi:L-arabinokinase
MSLDAAQIRSCYERAHLALELPFSGGFDVFPRVERLPLVARRPTRSRRDTRAFFDLPANGRVALLSFGGYGLASLDLSRVDCSPDWTIVTTNSVSGTRDFPSYVRSVPESAFPSSNFRYEDLIAAVDVVMTKPGYGIIAECVSTDTPMLYTSRGTFREVDVLLAALPKYVRSRFISQADLLGGRWREALEAVLLEADPPERMDINGAEVAAERLRDLAG